MTICSNVLDDGCGTQDESVMHDVGMKRQSIADLTMRDSSLHNAMVSSVLCSFM